MSDFVDLKEKLQGYHELKEFVEEYNQKQLQKGLDLGARIIQDLVCKYPNEIGCVRIEWENDYWKDTLVVKIGKPFENNGRFSNKKAEEYIFERYPDAKPNYLGIQVAKFITKRNIENFVEGDLE